MDSLLPCTRIGQTMLSFEGSLPKVGRTTLAQEESLFNICVLGLYILQSYSPGFKGSWFSRTAENASWCACTECVSYIQTFGRAHCITSKCAAKTSEYSSLVYSTMHVRGRLLLHKDPLFAKCVLGQTMLSFEGSLPKVGRTTLS